MKPFANPVPQAPPPPPTRPRAFDPWNSSSTGHQRREAPRSETDGITETGWRAARAVKVNAQFRTQADPPAAAAAAVPAQDQQQPKKPQRSVADMLARPGSMDRGGGAPKSSVPASTSSTSSSSSSASGMGRGGSEPRVPCRPGGRKIFDGLVVYVNGSTFPLVSDHKLKALLCENGARISLQLARRQVTHVVLGRRAGPGSSGCSPASFSSSAPASASASSSSASGVINAPTALGKSPVGGGRSGCGGGLAATKMDREVRRIGGAGIKYVGVEWVLESLEAGKRLPEARFSNLKMAAQGQASVYNMSKNTS